MRPVPDGFARERLAVERGMLPESACGLTSGSLGKGNHFAHYECEAGIVVDGRILSEWLASALRDNTPDECLPGYYMGWWKAMNGRFRWECAVDEVNGWNGYPRKSAAQLETW